MESNQTLPELLSKMQELQRQVESARKAEYAGVVRKVRQLIAEYGISAKDLGFADIGAAALNREPGQRKGAAPGKAPSKRGRKPGTKSQSKAKGVKVAPKYRDPQTGATWTGRGKRPRWIVEAVAAGRAESSFLITAAQTESSASQ